MYTHVHKKFLSDMLQIKRLDQSYLLFKCSIDLLENHCYHIQVSNTSTFVGLCNKILLSLYYVHVTDRVSIIVSIVPSYMVKQFYVQIFFAPLWVCLVYTLMRIPWLHIILYFYIITFWKYVFKISCTCSQDTTPKSY